MRYLYLLFLAFFCLLCTRVQAQGDVLPGVGARVVGLGNAFVGVRGSVWSLFQNPAAITGVDGILVGAYFEQRAFLRELTYANAGAIFPIQSNQAAGLELGTYGFSSFRVNRVGASYGVTILERLSMGAKVNLANMSIIDYGSATVVYADLGLHLKINEQLGVGFSATNVNRASVLSLTGVRSYYPTFFTLGLAYQPTDKVLIVADVQKDIEFPASFRGGVEYQINELVYARIGANSEPIMVAAGFGVQLSDAKLDFALSFTRFLGYSPHVSLVYSFGE